MSPTPFIGEALNISLLGSVAKGELLDLAPPDADQHGRSTDRSSLPYLNCFSRQKAGVNSGRLARNFENNWVG